VLPAGAGPADLYRHFRARPDPGARGNHHPHRHRDGDDAAHRYRLCAGRSAPAGKEHAVKRLLSHPSLVIGLVATLLFLAIGLLSLVWTPYPIAQIDIPRRFLAPSAAHWLGTDNL